MNWIKQFVILLVFASGLLARISSATRSKLRPAERYEFCVARNLSVLPMFSEEEKDRIDKIVMETSFRMHELNADPENASNTKTMLRLFAATLACVVADCDSSVRPQREKACIAAIETCAKSLKEPVGAEVVDELKRIFSAMNREISTLDAISSNSASAETKKIERLEEDKRLGKKAVSSEESQVKARSKRAYVPPPAPFEFTGFNLRQQSNPTLESIMADKLLRSVTFNSFFNFGLSQDDAIFYSTSMVASALNGYGYDVINEAINAVRTAMSRMGTIPGPSDYAFAIAGSISSVLADHDLVFFADGLNLGSALVYQLDSLLRPSSSSTFSSGFGAASASSGSSFLPNFGSSSASSSSFSSGFGAASASSSSFSPSFDASSVSSSRWGTSSAGISSQTSGMDSAKVNPGYVEPSFIIPANPQNDKNQFQNRLSFLLSQSEAISRAFCTGPFPGVYEVMNSAFSDYGYSISSRIATITSNSLSMLPTEAACTQYPEVISEIITDIFGRNDLISTADPRDITNKMSDLISRNIQRNPPQNPPVFGQQTFSGSDVPLSPSFSEFPLPVPKNPEFPADQNPDSEISSSAPGALPQQQNPNQANPTEFSYDASPPRIQTSSEQDFNVPEELRFGSVDSPTEQRPSSDASVATNDSWVAVGYPSGVPSASDQMNQTSESADVASPIILGPGPVIPENLTAEISSTPKSKIADVDQTTAAPEVTGVTRVSESTTPVPLSTSGQFSTVTAMAEVTTPAPQVALEDAFKSQSGLSDFIMKEMALSLKGMDITSGDEEKEPELRKTSGNSTGVDIPKATASSPASENAQTAEKVQDSMDKPSSGQVSTATQPSTSSSKPQYKPTDEVNTKTPEVITDEISGLIFGQKVLSVATNAIRFIRSPDFQLEELCSMVNELSTLLDMPPLDVCSEIPMIDFLLHAMKGVTFSYVGER